MSFLSLKTTWTRYHHPPSPSERISLHPFKTKERMRRKYNQLASSFSFREIVFTFSRNGLRIDGNTLITLFEPEGNSWSVVFIYYRASYRLLEINSRKVKYSSRICAIASRKRWSGNRWSWTKGFLSLATVIFDHSSCERCFSVVANERQKNSGKNEIRSLTSTIRLHLMLKIFLTCSCFFDSQKRTIEKLKDKFDRESEKFNKERMDRENEVSPRTIFGLNQSLRFCDFRPGRL